MTQLSGMVMLLLALSGEAAGSQPLQFRVVDADSGEPLPGVIVRQLPSLWEVRFVFQRPKGASSIVRSYTDESGEVHLSSPSRCTYFFETPGYVSVDVRKGWLGMTAYEEPYEHGSGVKTVDGFYLVPLRRSKDSP